MTCRLALATIAVLAAPPPLAERFPAASGVAHVLVVLDARDGRVLRVDGDADEPRPLGTLARWLVALAGLESGALDPDRAVPCDERCWAAGAHGPAPLSTGLALGCDTAADAAARSVSRADALAAAAAAGIAIEDGGTGRLEDDRASARALAGLWRAVSPESTSLRARTLTHLLAAAGTAVASPRGSARGLHDPRRRIRAAVGESAQGAWATGAHELRAAGRRWVFALEVRGGTASLAAARAAALLEETRRAERGSSAERGGEPWPELEGP